MTPIQKAKEIFLASIEWYIGFPKSNDTLEKRKQSFEDWLDTDGAAALLSGKDWISVKDRLPDYDVQVIVFGEAKGASPSMGGAYTTIAKRQDLIKTPLYKQADRLQDKNQFSHMAYVTHWMPLPEPPKP